MAAKVQRPESGHNRRHKPRENLFRYAESIASAPNAEAALAAAVTRWGVNKDDVQSHVTLTTLRELWSHWSEQERRVFLLVVEAVADAEIVKLPPARARAKGLYRAQARVGIRAMLFANDLIRWFGIPRHHPDTEPIGRFTIEVASFAVGMYVASAGFSPTLVVQPSAQFTILQFDALFPARSNRELLAAVVGVAVGKVVTSRSIRRMLQPGSAKGLERRRWHRYGKKLKSLFPIADPSLVDAYAAAGRVDLAKFV